MIYNLIGVAPLFHGEVHNCISAIFSLFSSLHFDPFKNFEIFSLMTIIIVSAVI